MRITLKAGEQLEVETPSGMLTLHVDAEGLRLPWRWDPNSYALEFRALTPFRQTEQADGVWRELPGGVPNQTREEATQKAAWLGAAHPDQYEYRVVPAPVRPMGVLRVRERCDALHPEFISCVRGKGHPGSHEGWSTHGMREEKITW